MSPQLLRAALCAGPIAFVALNAASAHEIVGNRFFPATLAIDDPGVNDELAFPTVAISKTGDDPSVKQLDISGEFSKRITEDFAVSFAPTWTRLYAPGGPNMTGASGFQNIETTFKYRVFKNDEHEFVMSVGLNIEWGGSGAQDVGAERFTVYTPTLYFGKGFGDLPASMGWARPFAITGQVGYAIPGSSSTVTVDPDTGDVDTEFNPRVLVWGGSLQYSLPYLKSAVVDLGLPDFVNHLIPIVEASLQTPVSQYVQFRHGDHRHHQSGRDLGRQILPGRRRGDDPDQPPERHQRRRHRAIAPVPRRHLPQLHRTADLRQQHRVREAERSANSHETFIQSSPSPDRNPASAPPRMRTPSSTTPARWSAARSPPRRASWCCGSPKNWSRPFPSIEVRNAQGVAVQSGKAQLDRNDGTRAARAA